MTTATRDSPEKVWSPRLRDRGPVYRDLVRALEADIRSGALEPGDRLPTHRELASTLGISRGTVAKAYDEAQRLGLAYSGVGQGTFVAHAYEVQARRGPDPDQIDFGMGYPIYELDPDLAGPLAAIAADPGRAELSRYPDPEGRREHRAAGARWCAHLGVETSADGVVVTGGGQHAIHTWLLSALAPGDTLLVGELTYRMAAVAAQEVGIEIRGVEMDAEGLLPDALAKAASETLAGGLYLMPTIDNPTTGVLSDERRLQIAEVIRDHDLRVLEDDIHGPFHSEPRPIPLKVLCPERVTYVASLSKSVVGGLRVAYAVPPERERPSFFSALVNSLWSPPPLTAEVAGRLIDAGAAFEVVAAKEREATTRLELLCRRLQPLVPSLRSAAYFAWMELPEPWTATGFALAARRQGVVVMSADAFYFGNGSAPPAVRIALGGVTRSQIERGADLLAGLLERPGGPLVPIV
ncbi:MAG: PLP-dependent aminotransferase family protein [Thermoanaerobaculia bacterium]|nr:PLP-dependent aminotransferase family protein [Thermoanaerobaculia bacterium]